MWGLGDGGYIKDGFHQRVIHGREDAVNPAQHGTKACAWYRFDLAPGQSEVIRMRLTERTEPTRLIQDFDGLIAERICEADEFYCFAPADLSEDGKRVQRQAFAGLLWSKQFYHFVIEGWLKGDPGQPPPPESRWYGRDSQLGPPVQRRRDLDAGYVGISVVRRVGSRVSHDPDGAGGSGLSPKASCACFCANGTCIRTGKFPPTNGRSAT